jgi:ABC-type transport system involved in Fe-S cluster assembly fused permease/ATPase subunit
MKKRDSLPTLKQTLTTLWPFFWAEQGTLRYRLFLGMACLFLSMGVNVYIPLILKSSIDGLMALKNGESDHSVFSLLISYVFLWILGQIMIPLREMIVFKSIQRTIRLFCVRLLEHIHNLPLTYHTQKQMGEITNGLERAQVALPAFVWGTVFLIIPTFIEIICATVIICYIYGYAYGVILLTALSVFAIFSIFSMRISLKAEQISNQKELNASGRMVDSLLNYTIIKYFHAHKYESEKCDRAFKEREIYTTKTLLILEKIKLVQGIILGMGLMVLLLFAGMNVECGTLEVSDFVLLNGYILQFSSPLALFGFVLRDAQQSFIDLSNVVSFFHYPAQTNIYGKREVSKPLTEIRFDHVTFGYDNKPPVLKDISFSIPIGKTTALVGSTGVGKSTLIHLLMGLYHPQQGNILLNGHPIHDFSGDSFFETIGIVPQDITFFNATILDNLRYANQNASVKNIKNALSMACFDLSVFPEGLETIVGEKGARLSQGEKQRLAIARLFLKKPDICILDEYTSALDLRTERQIQNNLGLVLKGHTFLIIAHRLRTIAQADQIIVFEKGHIIERGTHQKLMEKQGLYFRLWHEQQQKFPSPLSPI